VLSDVYGPLLLAVGMGGLQADERGEVCGSGGR
jgi:hypothetical protein